MDSFTGELVYGKNPDERLYPASATKILTALIIIEAGDLDKAVRIERSDTQVIPSAMFIQPGEKITRRTLLYGLMLQSGNDTALALARDNAGSVEAFTEKMTRRAHELGAVNSRFQNPHGLHHADHYTTARDMALIARAAMQQPFFRQLAATQRYRWETESRTVTIQSKNRLLREYVGCTGLKTGYTRAAQQVLVSSALRDGREYISVVLRTNRPGIWQDSIRLLDHGFARR